MVCFFAVQKKVLFDRIGLDEKDYFRSFLFPALLRSPGGALVTIGPAVLGVLFFYPLQWQVIAAGGGHVPWCTTPLRAESLP